MVYCFMWSGSLNNSGVFLSYPIISQNNHHTNNNPQTHHPSQLKAPGQAPRPTPYTFGEVDWCLTDLTHTERQMALIYYGRMVRRKLMCSDEEMKDFYLGLRRVRGLVRGLIVVYV